MEILDSTLISSGDSSSLHSPTSSLADLSHQNSTSRLSCQTRATSVTRLWRPAAQRNLKNQWSRLASYRQQWVSASSTGKSHATSVVNSHLSQRYMDAMNLGVLSVMPGIRMKAVSKLFQQQERNQSNLSSSYKELIVIVTHMVNTSRSMRCFLKGESNSPIVQFSNCPVNRDDTGDCRGIPVFTFWSISYIEKLAQELVEMFVSELNLKRLLVLELLSIGREADPQVKRLCWSNEIYEGEFDDLCGCNLYSKETCELVSPTLNDIKSGTPPLLSRHKLDHKVLQIYLTTWLSEVNIDCYRVREIFDVMAEEMHFALV